MEVVDATVQMEKEWEAMEIDAMMVHDSARSLANINEQLECQLMALEDQQCHEVQDWQQYQATPLNQSLSLKGLQGHQQVQWNQQVPAMSLRPLTFGDKVKSHFNVHQGMGQPWPKHQTSY